MSQWSFTHNLYPLPHTWWYVDRWTEWNAKPSAVTPEPKRVTWVDASAKQHHDEMQFLSSMTSMQTEPQRMTINRFHEPHLRFEQPFPPFAWRREVRHRCISDEAPAFGPVITWSDLAQIHKKCLKATRKTWELCDRLAGPPAPPLSPESSTELTAPEAPDRPEPKRVIWPDKDKSHIRYKPLRRKSWRERCQLRERWSRFQKEREETRARFLFRPGPGPIDRALIWLRIKFSRYPPATSPMKSCLKETRPRVQEPRAGPSALEDRGPAGTRYSSSLHVQLHGPDGLETREEL